MSETPHAGMSRWLQQNTQRPDRFDLVDFGNLATLATSLVVNLQVVGGDFFVEQHGLGFARVDKGIEVNEALHVHRANCGIKCQHFAIKLV